MATLTTRLNATKPASSENVDITVLNNNADLFDSAVGATVAGSGSRPASAFQGRMFYATDTAKLYVNTAASASAVASWQDPVANSLIDPATRYVRKSATTGRISNSTLADDPHITFSLVAGAVYELRCSLAVTGPAAGDIKVAWNITGAASAAANLTTRSCVGPAGGTTDLSDTNMRCSRHNWSTSVPYGMDGSQTAPIEESGLIICAAGAGTLTLQWAQNASTASSTTMFSDSSYAILTRVA